MSRTILPETLLVATICFADMGWTIYAVQSGIAHESNPLMALLIALK